MKTKSNDKANQKNISGLMVNEVSSSHDDSSSSEAGGSDEDVEDFSAYGRTKQLEQQAKLAAE